MKDKRIEIIFESNKETTKRNLEQVYDVINKIALTTSKNKTNWFYKEEEINNMKKNNNCNFL